MRTTCSSFRRRTALGCTAVVVLAGGLLVATPAFAATNQDGTLSDLQSDLGNSSAVPYDVAQLSADVDGTGQTLTIDPSVPRVLDLNGHTLRIDTLQLTSIVAGSVEGANLTVIDSSGAGARPGTGHLIVDHTSDSTRAAIEVDSSSTFTIKQAVVDASVPAGGTAAAIGGGGLVDLYTTPKDVESAGTIDFADGAVVTATGSQSGAAIGGGRFGGGGTITVEQTAAVTATGRGSAAAIGSGASATSSSSSITVNGYGSNTRGGVGASVTATATGQGAAIGGGFQGSGGSIAIGGYSSVNAAADEAAIGDGEAATGSSQIAISGYTTVTAAGGSAGGAGIGGGNTAYGNDSVTINGNSVVKATGANGPGIGGERNRYATTVSVGDSANVTAIGGGNGAGIGGGDSAGANYQSGASLSLGGTADLTVGTTNPSISAIGAGAGNGTGTISLGGGVLHLGSGQQITVPSGSTFTNNSLFQNAGTLTTSGSGVIDNETTILNTGTVSGAVKGYAYNLSYNPGTGSMSGGGNTERVFSDTLQQAQLTMPSAVPSVPGLFVGWNTAADGSGTNVEPSTSLSGLVQTSTGTPVTVPLYAIYQLYPVLGGPGLPNGTAHKSYSASVAATYGTGPLSYSETGSFPAGLKLDGATGRISGTPTSSGTYHFTVAVSNQLSRQNGRSITRSYTLTIGKALASTLTASVKAKHGFTLKVSQLLWSEPVRVTMSGPTKHTYTGKASKGVYSLAFKKGLTKKGKYTFTVTARSTGRILIVHLTVK